MSLPRLQSIHMAPVSPQAPCPNFTFPAHSVPSAWACHVPRTLPPLHQLCPQPGRYCPHRSLQLSLVSLHVTLALPSPLLQNSTSTTLHSLILPVLLCDNIPPDTICPSVGEASSLLLESKLWHHPQQMPQWQAHGVLNKCLLSLVGLFFSVIQWDLDWNKKTWTLVLHQSWPLTLSSSCHFSKTHMVAMASRPVSLGSWQFLKL